VIGNGESRAALSGGRERRLLALLGCGLALAGCAAVPAGAAADEGEAAAPAIAQAASASGGSSTAALEQCVSAPAQVERSASFSGEMTATAGTGRMSIRIELQERLPGEVAFHTVAAPGLGVWRTATPGVKVYRYIKQVTNLSAPAFYRAAVRFRWLTGRGRLIRSHERRTAACAQAVTPQPAGDGTTPTGL
jgi:hypothetical protein